MSSLGEKIAKLTNPCAEVILDPEDAVDPDSAAKVFTDEINETQENEISELRRKTAPLLEDVDPTYAGKKVLRRDLGRIFHEDDKSSPDDNDSVEETGNEVSYSEDDDGDISDEEMKNFKKLIASKSKESVEEDGYDNESEEEDNYDNEGEEIDSIDSEDEVGESNEEEEKTENKTSDEMTKQFSNIDVTSEMEKSQAINNQREIMNNLLEARIKLQKLLITVNRLPQFSVWERLKEKGGKEFRERLSKVVMTLIASLVFKYVLFSHSQDRGDNEAIYMKKFDRIVVIRTSSR
ncbi:protein AATF [Trichonephila clavata]|uniref:Protein AATF n=1 Tax=Trichonephila clavata TaxID=2740835 RepID=A0A8X6H7T1_TRICU|nr:protein AATF [Trichonephila clavata]